MKREMHRAITSAFPEASLDNPKFRNLSISLHLKDEEIDKLKYDIEELKMSHLDEVIALKMKISELIEQNYKLYKSQSS